MAEFDLIHIENQIRQMPTITQKLDYWNSIRKQYSDTEFLKMLNGVTPFFVPLYIPEPIYKEHFYDVVNEPEFTFWFIKYYAQSYLDIILERDEIRENLRGNSEKFVKTRLNKIKDFENRAETLWAESKVKLDSYSYNFHSQYYKEIEYLRIKNQYYETHALSDVHSCGSQTLFIYAEHILLKKNLENQALSNNENTLGPLKPLCFDDIKKSQNLLIPKVSIQNVYDHFKQLTSMTNKMDEFYLTEKQLLIFIDSTFIKKKTIRQNFNCTGIIKKEVRKIFYKFYFDNKNKEGNKTKIKRKYFNIMNDSFNGFNENDYTDFAK